MEWRRAGRGEPLRTVTAESLLEWLTLGEWRCGGAPESKETEKQRRDGEGEMLEMPLEVTFFYTSPILKVHS